MNKFPYYLHLEHQTYKKLIKIDWIIIGIYKPVFSTNYEEQLSYKQKRIYILFDVSSLSLSTFSLSLKTLKASSDPVSSPASGGECERVLAPVLLLLYLVCSLLQR